MQRFAALILLALFMSPGGARAQEPHLIIEGLLEDLATFWVPLNRDPDAPYQSRRKWTEDLIDAHFDLPHMTRSSLGNLWRGLTPEQQQTYSPLFREALIETVIDWLDGFDDQTFEVIRVRDVGKNTEIQSRFTEANGRTINVTWITRQTADGHLFRDVRVAGLSLTADFRGKYQRIIDEHGFEAFLQILVSDTAELRLRQS